MWPWDVKALLSLLLGCRTIISTNPILARISRLASPSVVFAGELNVPCFVLLSSRCSCLIVAGLFLFATPMCLSTKRSPTLPRVCPLLLPLLLGWSLDQQTMFMILGKCGDGCLCSRLPEFTFYAFSMSR